MKNDTLIRCADTPAFEERLDALANVLAEGFLYLAEHGLLDDISRVSTQADDSSKVLTEANKPRNE